MKKTFLFILLLFNFINIFCAQGGVAAEPSITQQEQKESEYPFLKSLIIDNTPFLDIMNDYLDDSEVLFEEIHNTINTIYGRYNAGYYDLNFSSLILNELQKYIKENLQDKINSKKRKKIDNSIENTKTEINDQELLKRNCPKIKRAPSKYLALLQQAKTRAKGPR